MKTTLWYISGKSQPRRSVSSNPLPSPADVASVLQSIPARNHESVTALLGSWAELLLHDLASTGGLKTHNCCKSQTKVHGECYGKLGNGKCLEYMRSLPAVDTGSCNFGKQFFGLQLILFKYKILNFTQKNEWFSKVVWIRFMLNYNSSLKLVSKNVFHSLKMPVNINERIC